MSEQEAHVGKLKLIFTGTEEEIEEFCKDKIHSDYNGIENEYFDSYTEMFEEELYRKFVIINNSIYEILEDTHLNYNDIFEASLNEDGTISYICSYYNDGYSFSEAIEECLDNI